MGNRDSTPKIDGAVNIGRTKPTTSGRGFFGSLAKSHEILQSKKTNISSNVERWRVDYKTVPSTNRGPIGIAPTYNYWQTNGLTVTASSTSNYDLTKKNTILQIYDQSFLQKFPKSDYDKLTARISSQANEDIQQREIERIRLKREEEEHRHQFKQHETRIPKISSILECIPIGDRLEAKKLNDQRIFPTRRYPELTNEINQVIALASKPYPEEEVLVDLDGVQILRKDIQTLISLNWLNDEIINAYMTLVVQRSGGASYKKTYSFNTFFYPKLRDSGFSSVKRWTRRVDIFSYSFVIIPLHLENHWCLAFVDFTKRTISYYDSMGGGPNHCLKIVLNYLREESNDKKKQNFDDENWRLVNSFMEGIPQQCNYSDCGVFTCMYAEHLTRLAKLDFSQKDMPYFRKKMIYEIVKKKILE